MRLRASILICWVSLLIPLHSWASQSEADPPPMEPMAELDAWTAAKAMGRGINIGNTLENTREWEIGWGNPPITREFVETLAKLGFKTVRVPVAWDAFAIDGRIQPDKLRRVREVVDWITGAGMFCVINIHWDGGWIDSSQKQRFAATHATFSPLAEQKFRSYWQQIATFFAGKNQQLVFEGVNEETDFSGEGSMDKAFATLQRVNQLFIDTVRATGGSNTKRLLIVTGYSTDIAKTTSKLYRLPTDQSPHRLLISVHYYTPWSFAGMTEDTLWTKVKPTWGSHSDVAELNRLFDAMQAFCKKNDIPAFVGEFNVVEAKEKASRVRWLTAVAKAALSRNMVPVLWDTGGEVSRRPPYAASPVLLEMLGNIAE
jgi:endoglucanase